MINWQNDPDGYAVTTLTTTGAVLALAESDTSGPVQWFSYWIAEGGHADSAVLAMDGHTVRILQGENAGQGLLMVWAIENGIVSNELVLMLLGEGYGSASYGSASTGNTGTGNTGTANAIALRSRATLKLVAKGALSGINSNNDWYGQVPATTLPGAVPFILLPTGGPDGKPCFQSGTIPHNGISQARFIAPSRGTFTIGYKVSSEGNYDFLTAKTQFSANNLFRVSGVTNWATATVTVVEGETLDITYTKDGSAVGGLDAGWFTVAFESDACILQGRAALSLHLRGGLSGAKTTNLMQGKTLLALTAKATISTKKTLKAKAAFRFMARHGIAQPPSGLAMQMKIIADPYRPDVILDQYLRVWFNGHPGQCRIALKLDDNAEFEPAFVWQNPGVIHPAIIKIDSAEIPADGQTHRLTVSVWQAIGYKTSARSSINDLARTPNLRPVTQPEWCGITAIRQGEVIRRVSGGSNYIIGHINDLTRIDWRHTGAVQIMARIPRHPKPGKTLYSTLIVGYADHDETTFYAEQIGAQLDWTNGLPEPVTFGVAAIQHGTFGPVTWANTPVNIIAVYPNPTDISTNPDVIAGTVETLDLGWMKEKIGQQVFAQFGWSYPGYYDSVTAEVRKRRDIVRSAIDQTLRRIKDITRQGGNVTLDDLGRFEARWNEARTLRSVALVASPGFITGVKTSQVLTDAQAKALKP